MRGSPHILVVDDDREIRDLLSRFLAKHGYRVSTAADGRDMRRILGDARIDLIVLDLMLPGINGLEVMKALKEDAGTRHIPTIMLTAKGEEADIVTGLELGADDYITKPFSPRVLLARVRAVLRRNAENTAPAPATLRIHDLEIHQGRRSVLINGSPADLTYTEFQILSLLAARPGWVFTRGQIVDTVRGNDYYVTDRSVDVQIVGLRKKLGPGGKYIETVRGVGYRFRESP